MPAITKDRNYNGAILAVISFSPMEYPDYCVGVPMGGFCVKVFSTYARQPSEESSDDTEWREHIGTENCECDGYHHRIMLHLRPFESIIIELPSAK